LRIYKEYFRPVFAFQRSLTTCREENPNFDAFIGNLSEKFRAANPELIQQLPGTSDLSFQSLLLKPLQRVAHIELMLKQILQETPTSHDDFQQMQAACQIATVVSSSIDEAKREADARDELLMLVPFILGHDELLAPHRWHVRNERVFMHSVGSHVPLQLFLFNDVLVVCEPLSDGYFQFISRLGLNDVSMHKMCEIENQNQSFSGLSASVVQSSCLLVTSTMTVVLQFESVELIDAWMKDFHATVDIWMQGVTMQNKRA
jgi:hypothetical protein